MLNITARDQDSFSAIEEALLQFDEDEVFLQYFDVAVQSSADVEGVTVILRNSKKFKKDLNKRKYIISIPTTLSIEAFEFIKKHITRSGKRVPVYSVLIKGSLESSEVKFILILSGFNDDSIRIISQDEEVDEVDTSGSDGDKCKPPRCPIAPNNKQLYRMYRPPEPLGPHPYGRPPFGHNPYEVFPEQEHNCPMPLMDCEEESFVMDTLNDE